MLPTTPVQPIDEATFRALTCRLEQAAGKDLPFLTLLIEVQTRLLGGQSGVVFVTEGDKLPRVVSVYPLAADRKARIEPKRMALLRDCVGRCRAAGKLSLFRVGMGNEVLHAVCVPLMRQGRIEGVAVTLVSPSETGMTPGNLSDDPAMASRLAQVQSAASLYPGHVAKRMLSRQVHQASETRAALAVLSSAHQAEHFEACCMAVCNTVKNELDAIRVSIGWAKEGSIHLMAMSDTENLDRRQDLARRIEAAMEECFDQAQAVAWPSEHLKGADVWLAQAVARCHQELVGPEKRTAACSAPLRYREQILGVLTVERSVKERFDGESASHLQAVADLVAPRLNDRFLDDQPLVKKAWRSATATAATLVGPQHVGWKVASLAVLVVLVYACLGTWTYRVDAPVVMEAGARRVYAASFDGFLDQVFVEVGQFVEAGQELARLDSTELELALAEVNAKIEEAQTRRVQYLSKNEPANARQVKAVIDQLAAQKELLTFQISRATLRAQEPGVVLTGDWREKQGVRLPLGEPIFEVAPITELRAMALVDEKDVDFVKAGAGGELALRAQAEKSFGIQVTRVVPVGEPREGKNVFEVRAALTEHPEWMRPGMMGTAKIEAGRARIIWIVTHELVDFLRLKLWM